MQTGVQLLTGFLLTLPFQQKFAQLGDAERAVYLIAVATSVVATGFLQAPVSVHRALFRKHRRKETVELAHKLAIVGICALACAVVAGVLHQLAGGLRAAMGYVGARDLADFREKARFMRISSASLRESHTHDVTITRESPNYPGAV